jgi:putative transposase
VVGPRAKREAVRVVREEAGLSERRAWGLIGMHRGSGRDRRKERNEGALRARLRELAGQRPRFGYRRLYIFLRREKTEDGTLRWRVNHKRVYRLYREEGLAMQRRRRKRFRAEARVPLALPTRAMDDYDSHLNGNSNDSQYAEYQFFADEGGLLVLEKLRRDNAEQREFEARRRP